MTSTELDDSAVVDPFSRAKALAAELCELAARYDLPSGHAVAALTGFVSELIVNPNTIFENAPEYVRDLAPVVPVEHQVVSSTHQFFDVLKARASRRDFGSDALDLPRLESLLGWTVGQRGETIAYDYRGAPLRYVPSAGGLASVDAYVIVNNVAGMECGSYYFDYRQGLVPISRGFMAQKVADMTPGQDWLARAAAVVIFVGNTERVEHKYGPMGFKLMLLDAGITAGHAELVAAALEIRATLLGGLPAAGLSPLLKIDGRHRVPLATLAVGTRSGRE